MRSRIQQKFRARPRAAARSWALGGQMWAACYRRALGRALWASLAAAIALSAFASWTGLARAESAPVAYTHDGWLTGAAAGQGNVFLGIPYASPPTGAARWRPPQPPVPWTGVRSSTSPGSACIQPVHPRVIVNFAPTDPPPSLDGSEDCLYLNVYTDRHVTAASRESPSLRPVMLWIHGGGQISGMASSFDATRLAQEHGVIVVTVNYRLGVFGYLAAPFLQQEAGQVSVGNYGLLDQQQALRWVRDNIQTFGGDPHNVTLFGESAGAWGVCYQLLSPAAAGLFHRAILESGPCADLDLSVSTEAAATFGQEFVKRSGCADATSVADCMRNLSSTTLVPASVGLAQLGSLLPWAAVHGDAVLPVAPTTAFNTGAFHQVPVLLGTNRDENRLFAHIAATSGVAFPIEHYLPWLQLRFGPDASSVLAHYPSASFSSMLLGYATVSTDESFACPNFGLATMLASYVPTFVYEFADPNAVSTFPPVPGLPHLGAYHTAEIAYIFQTKWSFADPAAFSPEQHQLADQMASYWTNFAKTGDPNAATLPLWPRSSRDDLALLQLTPGNLQLTPTFFADHQCDLWRSRDHHLR